LYTSDHVCDHGYAMSNVRPGLAIEEAAMIDLAVIIQQFSHKTCLLCAIIYDLGSTIGR
jgi:hypothetical protein